MFCQKCGAQLGEGMRFCLNCGAPVDDQGMSGEKWRQHATEEEKNLMQGNRVTPNVYLCRDGKYRWVYDLNLKGNPTARRQVQKILAVVLAAGLIFISFVWLLMAITDDMDMLESYPLFLAVYVGTFAALELIVFVVMSIVSLAYGGSYWTIFEMDEKQIVQTQMKKTFQRTQILAFILMQSDDNFSDMATTFKMAEKDNYLSPMDRVKKIRLEPRWDLIDLKGAFLNCPVYVEKEDFDFVLSYILKHVPEKAAAEFRAKGH